MNPRIKHSLALLVAVALLLAGFAGVTYAQDGTGATDPTKPNPDSPNAITLPDSGSTNTAGTAWAITNNGTGRVGYFSQNNTATTVNPALEARTVSTGTSAAAILGQALATDAGSTSAGVRGLNWGTGTSGYGVMGQHYGSGTAVYGYVAGDGGRGVLGNSTATSGAGKGVYGQTASYDGNGGYFANGGTSGGLGGVGVWAGSDGGSSTDTHPGGSWWRAAGEFAGSNGVIGASTSSQGSGIGVLGINNSSSAGVAVEGVSPASNSYAGYFNASGSSSTGAYGSGSSYGLYGSSASTGVYGTSGYIGVRGQGGTWGMYGDGTSYGVGGSSTYRGIYGSGGNAGVYGTSGYVGVWASGGTWGTYSTASCGTGTCYAVYGSASNTSSGTAYGGYFGGSYRGVFGSGDNAGVYGQSGYVAVWASGGRWGTYSSTTCTATPCYGVAGVAPNRNTDVWAGYFSGDVKVTGAVYSDNGYNSLTSPVTRIANPLNSSQYIAQTGVNASEQLGLQSGNVTLDAKGMAVITLPAWYDKIYNNFRYTLTAVGAPAPGLYVAQEVKGGQLTIAGGPANGKISWQVTGVRQDQFAVDNPFKVEVSKTDKSSGTAAEPQGKADKPLAPTDGKSAPNAAKPGAAPALTAPAQAPQGK